MVIVYGTICLDRISPIERLPTPGEYVELGEETIALGGEAANTAMLLRSLGADVTLVGNSIGVGSDAEHVRRLLESSGLGDAVFPGGDHAAPVCHIYVEPDGQRTMFGRGFAEMPDRNGVHLLPESGGDWICTDGNHGLASIKAIEWAHEHGARAYVMDTLDGAPTRSGDICQTSPNWVDGPDSREPMRDFAVEWADQQGCLALVTLGAAGVIAAMPGGQLWSIPAIPCPETVDSTGAGDAFRSGVLLGLEQDEPMDRCILLGLGAGSLACTQMGAIRADRRQLESLLQMAPDQVKIALSAASGLDEAYNSAQ